MTDRNDDGAEPGSAPSFRLWFYCVIRFFFASSFVLKREHFFGKRSNRRLFRGNDVPKWRIKVTMNLNLGTRAEFSLMVCCRYRFFFASSFVLKREHFFVKRSNRRLFLEMTDQSNDESETRDRRRVLLVIYCRYRLFLDSSFVLKSEFILGKRSNRRLFVEMTCLNDDSSKTNSARRVFACSLL